MGLLLAGGGAILGMAGASGAAAGGTGDAAAVAGAGGIVAVIGVIILILSIAAAACGFGIMNSKRWGFSVGMFLFAANTLLNIASVFMGSVQSIIGAAISGLLTYYCWARLNGKIGTPPEA